MAILNGIDPVVKSTFAANEFVVSEPGVLVFLKIETVLLPLFATAKSGLPSPSKSAMATMMGRVPVVKSTFEAKELVVIDPEVLVFLRTETLALSVLVTTRSGLPSPSKSFIATQVGFVPVAKSTREAKELAVIDPEVLVFLKTETTLLPLVAPTMSSFPSPSTSPTAIMYWPPPVVNPTFGANELVVIGPEVLVFLSTEVLPLEIKSSLPSPSISPGIMHIGFVPVAKSTCEAKEVASITCELGKVTIKGALVYAVNPLTVTVIGWYVAPTGIITLSEFVEAVATTAFTAPKYTTLFAAVVLKFVPVIVTVVPMDPDVGEKEVIVGGIIGAFTLTKNGKVF
jgi:hypothetical protein